MLRKKSTRMSQDSYRQNELYRCLVENMRLGIAMIDKDYRIILVNPAQGKMLRKDPARLAGHHCYEEFEKRRAVCPHCPGTVVMREGEPAEAESTGIRDDGTTFSVLIRAFPTLDENGKSTGFIEIVEDITERRALERELRQSALMDALTGLYNRRGFLTLADQQMKMTERTQRIMWLCYADLDDLKSINDSLGHEEGDRALADAATIFKATFREADIIGRMGGDEFTILMPDAGDMTPDVIMDRLQYQIEAHNSSGKRSYPLSISMGVAVYDPHIPCSLDQLISFADKMMYQQKRAKPFSRR